MNLSAHGPMIYEGGPEADVVISCRARLARNIAGFPFVNRASETQCQEILNLMRGVLLSNDISDGMIWVDLSEVTPLDRQLLVERHLISRNHAEADTKRAVAVSGDEALSVMINEEDHLRIQVLAPGLCLDRAHHRLDRIDDSIESRLDYAVDDRWGYLTACPTNVGTGARFGVMMHLPALKITNEIERVRRGAKDLNLAVRGYYGEGSEAAGDFYQVSNQITLGAPERDLLTVFQETILPKIIEYEREARRMLIKRNRTILDDRVHRALGALQSARLLGAEEAMKLLSRLRLGICLERIRGVELGTINRLFLQVQPAHLRMSVQHELDNDELREVRAELVRKALG